MVLAAVRNDGCALEFASDRLKNDKDIVLNAIKNNINSSKYASKSLLTDPNIRKQISEKEKEINDLRKKIKERNRIEYSKKIENEIPIKSNFEDFENFNISEFSDNKEIILKIIKEEPGVTYDLLLHDSSQITPNKRNEFYFNYIDIPTYCSQDSFILKYVSDKLKDDKEVVIEAIKRNGLALEFASDRLKDDKDIVIEAVKNNGFALEFASDRLKNDKEIVFNAVKNNIYSLKFANKKFLLHPYIIKEQIKQKRETLWAILWWIIVICSFIWFFR